MPSTSLTRDRCPSRLRHRLANGGVVSPPARRSAGRVTWRWRLWSGELKIHKDWLAGWLAGGNRPCAVRDQRSRAASLVQAAGTAQGGSAVAAGKAGARRATVLHAAAASLAELPFSGRPPPRTPPRVPGDGRHQRTGSRQAPKTPDVHGDNRCTNRRRSGTNGWQWCARSEATSTCIPNHRVA